MVPGRLRRYTAALVLAAVAAAPAAAHAAPVPIAPIGTTTSTPTFTWAVPSGETTQRFLLGTMGHTTSSGLIHAPDVDHATTATSYTVRTPLRAGTYWWQVASERRSDGQPLHSAPTQLIVTPSITLGAVTPRSGGGHATVFSARLACNLTGSATATLTVMKGTRRVARTTTSMACAMAGAARTIRWTNAGVASGTRLVGKLVVRGGGASASRSVPFVAR